MDTHNYDIVIIGGGIAGLSAALRLAENAKIAIIAKCELTESASLYAQGGIAAVLDSEDSTEDHIQDTLKTGAGLCNEATVRHVVECSADAVHWLIEHGVIFTRVMDKEGKRRYHLTREGGHSHRRVIHSADATGHAVETTLADKVRNHPNISLFENHISIDLITTEKLGLPGKRCLGCYVLNRESSHVEVFAAQYTILATGGANKVYLYTTNPDVSTGDGIAMAWRAGCRVANMEFIQFHPTCMYHPQAKSFLLSEAIRGEGGKLLLPNGQPFMQHYDPREELAPRDIVARAIDHEMKVQGFEHVLLDISHKPEQFILDHFPNIYARCLKFGYDMAKEPIPVVPAAHYTCGGVITDMHGRTDLDGLYAIGETSHTGLHGANRLASNSLLECVVFARDAAIDITDRLATPYELPALPAWDESRVTNSDEEVVVTHNWHELRRFMWDYVGIVRTNKRLQRAQSRIALLLKEIHEYYGNFRVTNDLLELRNLAVVADLIIQSALLRKESRGLHYTLDYPDTLETAADTILTPATHGGQQEYSHIA